MAQWEPTVLYTFGMMSVFCFFLRREVLVYFMKKKDGKFVPFYKYSVYQNGYTLIVLRVNSIDKLHVEPSKSLLLTCYTLFTMFAEEYISKLVTGISRDV